MFNQVDIKQSESSVLKKNFFRNFSIIVSKMSIKKRLIFSNYSAGKSKNPLNYEIDVYPYFLQNYLDAYIVQNRVIRLSKSLFTETYWIKVFTYDPHIAYQSFKITA